MKSVIFSIIICTLLGACALVPQASGTTAPGITDIPSTAVKPNSTPKSGDAVLTFTRSGGLAGKTQKWAFYSDGRIVSDQGTAQVSAGDITLLVDSLKTLGINDLKDSYGGLSTCNDCFTYTISLSTDAKPKTITITEGASDIPQSLTDILGLINALIAKNPVQ